MYINCLSPGVRRQIRSMQWRLLLLHSGAGPNNLLGASVWRIVCFRNQAACQPSHCTQRARRCWWGAPRLSSASSAWPASSLPSPIGLVLSSRWNYFSPSDIGDYHILLPQIILKTEDDEEKSVASVSAVLFFVLALQTGLTGMEGEKRFQQVPTLEQLWSFNKWSTLRSARTCACCWLQSSTSSTRWCSRSWCPSRPAGAATGHHTSGYAYFSRPSYLSG